jgi:hypothetical protein
MAEKLMGLTSVMGFWGCANRRLAKDTDLDTDSRAEEVAGLVMAIHLAVASAELESAGGGRLSASATTGPSSVESGSLFTPNHRTSQHQSSFLFTPSQPDQSANLLCRG